MKTNKRKCIYVFIVYTEALDSYVPVGARLQELIDKGSGPTNPFDENMIAYEYQPIYIIEKIIDI